MGNNKMKWRKKKLSYLNLDTADLVIFARFYFSRISRGGQIRKFKNLAKVLL